MNPEIKAKWVAELRSGRRWQAKSALRTEDNRYCCLGVLCDIVEPEGWHGTPTEHKRPDGIVIRDYWHTAGPGLPSLSLCEKVGLLLSEATQLASLNDAGNTFADIADRIEESL